MTLRITFRHTSKDIARNDNESLTTNIHSPPCPYTANHRLLDWPIQFQIRLAARSAVALGESGY